MTTPTAPQAPPVTSVDAPTTSDAGTDRLRFAAVTLDRVPDVVRFVSSLGLGTWRPEEVESYLGRNDNWAAVTDAGHGLFVKRLGTRLDDGPARLDRTRVFARFAAEVGDAVPTPRLLGTDDATCLAAWELVPDARTALELASSEDFTPARSAACGRILGAVHAGPAVEGISTDAHPLPPLGMLDALPVRMRTELSAAQVEMWALLQSDEELHAGLRDLRSQEAAAERTPVHADLRLDQFLVAGDRTYLTDWEEFRLGDPARDVGAYVGEWLHQAVAAIPLALSSASGFVLEQHVSSDDVVARGAELVLAHADRLAAFWDAYADAAGLDETTALGRVRRAARYAGWHLVERMIASATGRMRLDAVHKAAAGIGRRLVLAPEGFDDLVTGRVRS